MKAHIIKLVILVSLSLLLNIGACSDPLSLNTPLISVNISSEFIQPQEEFDVDINIDSSGSGIYGIQYTLTYDPSVLRAETQVKRPFLGSDTIVVINKIDHARGIISYAETMKGNDSCAYGKGTLSTIQFTAIGERGAKSNLNLSDVVLVDCTAIEIQPISTENASIEIYNNSPPVPIITPVHRINNVGCRAKFYASDSYDPDYPYKGGNITHIAWAFGDGQYSNSTLEESYQQEHEYISWNWIGGQSGSYIPFNVCLMVIDDGIQPLTNTTCLNVTVYIAGDTNGDGRVNIMDAVNVGKYWGASSDETTLNYVWSQEHKDGADLNNDCQIDIMDAAIVGSNWGHIAW